VKTCQQCSVGRARQMACCTQPTGVSVCTRARVWSAFGGAYQRQPQHVRLVHTDAEGGTGWHCLSACHCHHVPHPPYTSGCLLAGTARCCTQIQVCCLYRTMTHLSDTPFHVAAYEQHKCHGNCPVSTRRLGTGVCACRFTFDHVYDQDSTQSEVYDQTAKPLVLSTLQVRPCV
jgi:hypothetical protein